MSEIAARLVSCAKRSDLDKACRTSSLSDCKTAISKCFTFMFFVQSETDGFTELTPQRVFWLTPSFYPLLPSGNSSSYFLKKFELLKPPSSAQFQWLSLGTLYLWIFPGTAHSKLIVIIIVK